MYWKTNGVGFLSKCPWGTFVLGVGKTFFFKTHTKFHMQVLTICTFGKLYSFERKKNVVPGNEIKRIETEIRNPYFFQKKSAKEKKERMYWKRLKEKKMGWVF